MPLPSRYPAKSRLLRPTERGASGFSLLAGMIQTSALINLGLAAIGSLSDVFGKNLWSCLLSEAAVTGFGPMRTCRRKDIHCTIKDFRRHTPLRVNTAGLLNEAFEDRATRRAADVSHFLVSEFDRSDVGTDS